MSLPTLLSHFLDIVSQSKYALIFFGAIIEGPILTVASGFLLHLGVFNVLPLFLSLAAGDLAGDVIWYYVGYFLVEPMLKKNGHFLSVTPEVLEKTKELFHRYHARILLISKITMGFGMALVTLMVAGISRVSFRTYMILNTLGEIVLLTLMLSIGYFFGQLYPYVAKDFRLAFVIGIIIITVIFVYGFSRYMKKKITSL